MTYRSIYEIIPVAVCFPIDPSPHHWAVLWAVLEIHFYVRWLLYELVHAAAFSNPRLILRLTLNDLRSISVYFIKRVSKRSHICNVFIVLFQFVISKLFLSLIKIRHLPGSFKSSFTDSIKKYFLNFILLIFNEVGSAPVEWNPIYSTPLGDMVLHHRLFPVLNKLSGHFYGIY